MSFSYNQNRITASGTYTVDFVRFTLQDDVETDATTGATIYELSDEVIIALFNETNSGYTQTTRNYITAIKAARYLRTKYSKQVASFSSNGVSINYGERKKALDELIARLEAEIAVLQGVAPVLYPYRETSFGWR